MSGLSNATTDPFLVRPRPHGLELVGVVRRPHWLHTLVSNGSLMPRAFIATVLGPANLSVEGADTPFVYLKGGEIGALPVGLPYNRRLPFAEIISSSIKTTTERFDAWTSLERVLSGMVFAKKGGAICIADGVPVEQNRIKTAFSPLDKMEDFEVRRHLTLQSSQDFNAINPGILTAHDQFEDAIADIVRMTTIDGATLLNPRLQPIAFGCKLPIEIQENTDCVEVKSDGTRTAYDPSSKGTRHKSAVAWVADQLDARHLAIVVSQDGDAMLAGSDGRRVYIHRFRPQLLGWHRNPS